MPIRINMHVHIVFDEANTLQSIGIIVNKELMLSRMLLKRLKRTNLPPQLVCPAQPADQVRNTTDDTRTGIEVKHY